MPKLAEIRIEPTEVEKLTEDQFEYLLTHFHVIFTENKKDVAVSVPVKEYEKMVVLEKEVNVLSAVHEIMEKPILEKEELEEIARQLPILKTEEE